MKFLYLACTDKSDTHSPDTDRQLASERPRARQCSRRDLPGASERGRLGRGGGFWRDSVNRTALELRTRLPLADSNCFCGSAEKCSGKDDTEQITRQKARVTACLGPKRHGDGWGFRLWNCKPQRFHVQLVAGPAVETATSSLLPASVACDDAMAKFVRSAS